MLKEKSKKSAAGPADKQMYAGGANETVNKVISAKDAVFSKSITDQSSAFKTGLFGLENG